MKTTSMSVCFAAALAALASACGPGRTAAATQPTPAAFDPAGSDAKAIEIADATIAAIGGADAWAAVKQVRWEVRYTLDGQLKSWVRHSWDIWNGRHRCELADMSTMTAATPENPSPDPPKFSVAMYDLFDHEGAGGHATYGGKEVGSDSRMQIKKNCYALWRQHSYLLVLPHKLKDPGVKLEHAGQLKDVNVKTGDTVCSPSCDSLKITFDPAVGKDTWWLHVNSATKMPELIEKKMESGGRLAYVLSDWTDVSGIKLAGKHQNAGLPGEVFTFQDLQIGSPDDDLYIPQVQ